MKNLEITKYGQLNQVCLIYFYLLLSFKCGFYFFEILIPVEPEVRSFSTLGGQNASSGHIQTTNATTVASSGEQDPVSHHAITSSDFTTPRSVVSSTNTDTRTDQTDLTTANPELTTVSQVMTTVQDVPTADPGTADGGVTLITAEGSTVACYGCCSSPCLNGGTCTGFGQLFSCACPLGYTGSHCQSGLYCFLLHFI